MGSNVVIGSTAFTEGVHYWEIICPIFCNSIGKSRALLGYSCHLWLHFGICRTFQILLGLESSSTSEFEWRLI